MDTATTTSGCCWTRPGGRTRPSPKLEKALAIRDRLAAGTPSIRRAHEQALTRPRLADLLVRARKLPAADSYLQAALPVLEKHAALPALAADYHRDFADAQQTLGELRAAQGK